MLLDTRSSLVQKRNYLWSPKNSVVAEGRQLTSAQGKIAATKELLGGLFF